MADALIPVFSGALAGATVQLCDARTLHAFMQVRRDFSNWIKGRIRKFGFVVDEDFLSISRSPELASGNRGASIDYHLTLDMAKELAMVENNEHGRAARRYFIACERQLLEQSERASYGVQSIAQPDAGRMQAAFDAAAQASAAVQKAVFNAVLSGNDEWKFSRWLLAFIDDSSKGAPAYVRQMEQGAFVATWPRLVKDVASGECMCTSAELLDMAVACMQRLKHRVPARQAIPA